MQLNIDIEGLAVEALQKALEPERLREILDKKMRDTVDSTIGDLFGYHTDFTKLLRSQLAGVMPAELGDLGRFGDYVLNALRDMLATYNAEALRQVIEPRMEKLLQPIKPVMTLGEMLAQLLETAAQRYEHREAERMMVIVTEPDEKGWWNLGISLDADECRASSWHGCDLRMRFKPAEDGSKESVCWDVDTPAGGSRNTLVGAAFSEDALVLNIYTLGTRIIYEAVDTEEYYYPGRGDY